MLLNTFGQAASSLALVGLALVPNTPVLVVFAVAFVTTAMSAIQEPARSSAVPRLVPAVRLPAAMALNQVNYQIASVVGPAIGGVIIAVAGLPAAYAVDVVSFVAAVAAVLAIAPMPPLDSVARPGLAAIREGVKFAKSRPVITATFAIDLDAMIFGMPTSLFPALAVVTFHGGPTELGLLVAAPAAGALIGALLSGWVSAVRRTGRATILAVLGWGLAITAFGLATFSLPLALLFLAIAGASDVVSAVFRSTIVQLETPDELRGRMSALHLLVVTSGPRMGDLEAAAVASIVGAQLSVISGGILCILGVAVVAKLYPELSAHLSRVGSQPVVDETSSVSA
jgi:MFS family permease